MTEEVTSSKKILKRLGSLKMSDDVNEPLLCKNSASCEANSKNGSRVKNGLQNIINIWRKKVAARHDADAKAKREKNLHEEQKMRHKLEYHFLTPFEKYRRGRKPWKLAIQILKIIIVTIQVSLFAVDRFAFVTYFKHTKDSFNHLFIKGWHDDYFISYYSRKDVLDAVNFAKERYHSVEDISIGTYAYIGKNESITPIFYCSNYRYFGHNPYQPIQRHDVNRKKVCYNMDASFDPAKLIYEKNYFERIDSIDLHFKLSSIYLAGIKVFRASECFTFNITLQIDNTKNDGRLPVKLIVGHILWTSKCPVYRKDAKAVTASLQAFDITVILVCFISCTLCVRSVFKSVKLAKRAKAYFKEYRDETLTRWDMLQFINKWFLVIVISDCLSIVGSFYKILIDERDLDYYNPCSIIFGLAVLLVWIGLLRFLTYLKAYNILMITLRVAAPNLLRFISCVIFIFLGFSFCGWVVLGPYHTKFRTMLLTMECLFSLLNGDDMYPTFTKVSRSSGTGVLIFSKLYLYGFISFFIYVVLSTFISIVGDTYERLKDLGRLPDTRIESFILGKRRESIRRTGKRQSVCRGCARSAAHASTTSSPRAIQSSYLDESFEKSLRSSLDPIEASVESASLE